jgi:hypothetical protein
MCGFNVCFCNLAVSSLIVRLLQPSISWRLTSWTVYQNNIWKSNLWICWQSLPPRSMSILCFVYCNLCSFEDGTATSKRLRKKFWKLESLPCNPMRCIAGHRGLRTGQHLMQAPS